MAGTGTHTLRVAVAAPFPEMVRINEQAAEYADELEVCAMIASPELLLDRVRLLQPDVLLLSTALGCGGDMLSRLTTTAPSVRLVILTEAGDDAAPVIADAVVQGDAPAAHLRDVLIATVAAPRTEPAGEPRPGMGRVQAGPEPQGISPPPWLRGPGPERAPASPAPAGSSVRRVTRSTLVLVFSGKGGVGTSLVAANLATALATGGASVALVDLDLQHGDAGLLLHLESHPVSIAALVADAGPAAVERALATSREGVRVLLAPTSPEVSDAVSASAVTVILDELSRSHEYVVVDTPSQLDERTVAAMQVADQVLLVSSHSVTSVKDTKVTLRLLQSLGIAAERVAVVVNQPHARVTVAADDIETALRFPVLASLPYESRMEESVDSGRPLVVSEPRAGFSRRLRTVVDHVCRAGSQAISAR